MRSALLRLWPLALLLLVVTGAAPASAPSDTLTASTDEVRDVIRKSFDVRSDGTLQLDLDRGNIVVVPGGGSKVRIAVERRARASNEAAAKAMLERHEVTLQKRTGGVRVKAHYDGRESFWGRWRGNDEGERLDVQVRVEVPRRYNVDFATGAGNVEIAGLNGAVEGETGAGNIALGDINGPVAVRSGAGNVAVEGATDRLSVEVGAGNVELEGVRGQVEARTGAGNIEAYITRQPEGASTLSSGAGHVTAYLAERVTGLRIDASTSMGSAETDFELDVEDGWVGKSFTGTIGQGGPVLRLSAGMGNVALRKR